MSSKCALCGSYQFNLHQHLIDQGDLCDVHFWQNRATRFEAALHEIANYQSKKIALDIAEQETRRRVKEVLE